MTLWICDGCGIEHADTPRPPDACVLHTSDPVPIEQRGHIPPHGTAWTTHQELAELPHETEHVDHGRGVHSLRRTPRFAIGHRSFLVQTPAGNLLWDPPAYVDDDVVSTVTGLGGVSVIASSHPHVFGAQLSWSRAFSDAPVLVNGDDREFLPHTDPAIVFWGGSHEPLPGVTLLQLGGHMVGSSVAITEDGTLLAGDTISGAFVPGWVTFRRNFPWGVPLSPAVVRRIVDALEPWRFDRLYTLGGDEIDQDAHEVVRRCAELHIRHTSGEFDHLT